MNSNVYGQAGYSGGGGQGGGGGRYGEESRGLWTYPVLRVDRSTPLTVDYSSTSARQFLQTE